MKTILTVNGPVPTDRCGMVLSHEHLFIDLTNQAAPGAPDRPLTASDHAALMTNPYQLKDNLRIDSFERALEECRSLIEAGCNTVVDCTTAEIGRDPALLRKLSLESGMNIVMGCGNYTADTHAHDFLEASVDEASERLLAEVTEGFDGIRPGIIGEIGTSREIQPSEHKALLVAAHVQKETGLAVQVHIYPWCTNGLDVIRILTEAGVPPERIVICHSDVSLDRDYIFAMLSKGVYVQFDNFGKEFTPEPGGFAAGRFASDAERVRMAADIIRNGFEERMLLTNDICLKCMLRHCGGQGYTHIFANIVPLLVREGLPADLIRGLILRENPLRLLA